MTGTKAEDPSIGAEQDEPQPALLRPWPSDLRRLPARPDLAAISLRGQIQALRYAQGVTRQVARPVVPVRRRPEAGAPLDTEAVYGDIVTVYDEVEGWAWVQMHRDQYVGYMPAEALTADVKKATHRVRALGTFVYPIPDIKAPPLMLLSLNSLLAVTEESERFCRMERGGFVARRHVTALNRLELDFVDVAERLIGTPYLWGGRTRAWYRLLRARSARSRSRRYSMPARQRHAGCGDRGGCSDQPGRGGPSARGPCLLERPRRHDGRCDHAASRQCALHGRHRRGIARGGRAHQQAGFGDYRNSPFAGTDSDSPHGNRSPRGSKRRLSGREWRAWMPFKACAGRAGSDGRGAPTPRRLPRWRWYPSTPFRRKA